MEEMQGKQEKVYVTFRSEDDIIQFVNICRKYDDSIDVMMGKMTTDAKSILGMLLLEIGQPVAISYNCYDEENNYQEFMEDIYKKFDIKVISPEKRTGGMWQGN